MLARICALVAFLALLTPEILADTPANCTYDDIVGNWIFYESDRGHSSSVDCDTASKNQTLKFCKIISLINFLFLENLTYKSEIELLFPNVASK